MIVVDASALAAFILKEPEWEELGKYLRCALSVDHVVKEVANVIWKAARVRRILSAEDARRALSILYRLIGVNIELYPELDYVPRALEIALGEGITLYDALYIALAIDKGLPLLSLDERQRDAAKRLGVEVVP